LAVVYRGLVTCLTLANRKSATVLTRNFAATQYAPASQPIFNGLLCQALRSPVEVSFSSPRTELAIHWRSARTLWDQHRHTDAITDLSDSIWRSGPYSWMNIPTLVFLSHLQLEVGDPIGAERNLQTAIRKLGTQTEIPTRLRSASFSRLGKFDTGRTYAFYGRDWLILALHALAQNDAESCLLWIHQADRCLFDAVDASISPRRLQLIGDLHAVLACMAVQSNELVEAESFLATAYERHSQAEAYSSICRDLILASRLAFIQGQTQRAHSLLAAAECQLVTSLNAIEADHHPLMKVIQRTVFQMVSIHGEQEPDIFKMPVS
jgi:hypothetical protein